MSPTSPSPSDFEAVFDASPGNYLLLSPDLTIVSANRSYLQATMTRREDIIGRLLFEVFPDNPNDPAADGVRKLRASLERVLAQKRPDRMPLQHYDIRRPESDGGGFEERYWSPLNSPVLDDEGNVRYIIHWVEDVTEFVRLKRQMFSQELHQREEVRSEPEEMEADGYLKGEAMQAQRRLTEIGRHYRFLTDLVPQLIWTADAQGSADYFNQRWVDFTGVDREELLLNGWERLVHPEDRDRTIALWTETVRTAGDQYQLQHRLRYRDGSYRWMLTTALPYRGYGGRILKWFGSTADVHDKVVADERLQQAQRLQAAGQLAGGVAHEVNNMMTIVMGCGEFALESLGPDDPERIEVEEMIKAASRAADVTRQLLAYSRQQVFRIEVLDLNEVVRQLTPALNRLIGSDRQLAIRHAPSPVWVRADRGQLEQVIINLVANARDATGTDGLVRIDTGLDERPDQLSERSEELPPGPFVRLSVRDNGSGMSPDVAARVFEPFFTTKPVGQGTGLGLSMVYGIVKQTGGFPDITTAPGDGTTVTIYLPAVDEESAAEPVATPTVHTGGAQILVVEDDPRVRAITRRTLQAAGYAVYEAITGLAAINFLDAHPGEIDLLVSDVVMPGANGREMANLLRSSHPDVPIVFMSGYPSTEIERRGLKVEAGTILQKPFPPEALIAVVSETLSRRPSPHLS